MYPAAHSRPIEQLHRELGIPPDYATRRALPLQPEADESQLTIIGRNDLGNPIKLHPLAAAAWQRMQAAALASCEITLKPLSGFRSVQRQVEIIRGKLSLNDTITHILSSVAAPGYSEHHTGRALDISDDQSPPLEEIFAETKAFAWLQLHAHEYSFHMSYPQRNPQGFVYEPWHWCWHEA